MSTKLTFYTEWFDAYVNKFMQGPETKRKYVRLKYNHTLRVVENATLIADSLLIQGQQRKTTLLGALFHDVGRFAQYEKFKTFSDKNSVNHGLLGSRILKHEDVLHDETIAVSNAVRVSVALHNRFALPSSLPEEMLIPLQIVRDSDKLDIFPVLIANFIHDGSEEDVVTMGLKNEEHSYSSKMLNDFLEGKPLKYGEMEFVNDFKLLLASWVYSLNYPVAVRLLHERGEIYRLLNTLPLLPEMDKVKHAVRFEIDRVIRGESTE